VRTDQTAIRRLVSRGDQCIRNSVLLDISIIQLGIIAML